MIEYKQYISLQKEYIKRKINEFLTEDMVNDDVTTNNTIKNHNKITAEIYALEKLIFVGSQILPHFFNSKCQFKCYKKDGENVMPNEKIGEIIGPANIILSVERVMLNLIQRLSGIATMTQDYIQILNNNNIKILDTRKTTPGLRLFEKHAVALGGGYNHRLDLSKGILIKDNHIIAAGSITDAITLIKKNNLNLPIEIEIDNLYQLKEALTMSINGVLLDNMSISNIIKAVEIIRNNKNNSQIFIEASGGITKKNLQSFVNTGVNGLSIGAITHSAISKDIKLEFI